MLKVSFLLQSIYLILLFVSTPAYADFQSDRLMLKAKKALESQQWEKANDAFDELLQLDAIMPASVHFNYAKSLIEVDRKRDAFEQLKLFFDKSDNSSSLYMSALELYVELEEGFEEQEAKIRQEQSENQEKVAEYIHNLNIISDHIQQVNKWTPKEVNAIVETLAKLEEQNSNPQIECFTQRYGLNKDCRAPLSELYKPTQFAFATPSELTNATAKIKNALDEMQKYAGLAFYRELKAQLNHHVEDTKPSWLGSYSLSSLDIEEYRIVSQKVSFKNFTLSVDNEYFLRLKPYDTVTRHQMKASGVKKDLCNSFVSLYTNNLGFSASHRRIYEHDLYLYAPGKVKVTETKEQLFGDDVKSRYIDDAMIVLDKQERRKITDGIRSPAYWSMCLYRDFIEVKAEGKPDKNNVNMEQINRPLKRTQAPLSEYAKAITAITDEMAAVEAWTPKQVQEVIAQINEVEKNNQNPQSACFSEQYGREASCRDKLSEIYQPSERAYDSTEAFDAVENLRAALDSMQEKVGLRFYQQLQKSFNSEIVDLEVEHVDAKPDLDYFLKKHHIRQQKLHLDGFWLNVNLDSSLDSVLGKDARTSQITAEDIDIAICRDFLSVYATSPEFRTDKSRYTFNDVLVSGPNIGKLVSRKTGSKKVLRSTSKSDLFIYLPPEEKQQVVDGLLSPAYWSMCLFKGYIKTQLENEI